MKWRLQEIFTMQELVTKFLYTNALEEMLLLNFFRNLVEFSLF